MGTKIRIFILGRKNNILIKKECIEANLRQQISLFVFLCNFFVQISLFVQKSRMLQRLCNGLMLFFKKKLNINSNDRCLLHCQKFGSRWRLHVRTQATMAVKSNKKMYGDKETSELTFVLDTDLFNV